MAKFRLALNACSTRNIIPYYLFIIIIIVITCIRFGQLCGVGADRVPTPVIVNKCCGVGQNIGYIGGRQHQCVDGGTKQWWPIIYMEKRHRFFKPDGEAPTRIHARENNWPSCSEFKYFRGHNVLFSNGSLYVVEQDLLVNANMYCLDKNLAVVCLADNNNNNNSHKQSTHGNDSPNAINAVHMIRKCCLQNLHFQGNDIVCVPSPSDYMMRLSTAIGINDTAPIKIIYGLPICTHLTSATKTKYVFDQFNISKILQNGSYALNTHATLTDDDFCVENSVDSVANESNATMIIIILACDMAVVVSDELSSDRNGKHFVLYREFIMISAVCLAVTLFINLLMTSAKREEAILQWHSQNCYIACLMIGEVLQSCHQTTRLQLTGIYCAVLATVMHFFFLAAFFWLNVSVININRTVIQFRSTAMEKYEQKKLLFAYSIYAWGFPVLITSVGAIVDTYSLFSDIPRPKFAVKSCWFSSDIDIFIYFFAPIGLLLFANLCMFASTTWQLYCGFWRQDSPIATQTPVHIYFKLVIVMGITWIADILSWSVNIWMHPRCNYICYIIDIVNALQGVWILLVYTTNSENLAEIKHIFGLKSK